jgi:hypothetical protein
MFFKILLYLLCFKAAFALQIPRQATVSYTNTSTSVATVTSTTPGPVCCVLYATGVVLNFWYDGSIPKVPGSVTVTEYLRYNSTSFPSPSKHMLCQITRR